jgi:hypothetical protein
MEGFHAIPYFSGTVFRQRYGMAIALDAVLYKPTNVKVNSMYGSKIMKGD